MWADNNQTLKNLYSVLITTIKKAEDYLLDEKKNKEIYMGLFETISFNLNNFLNNLNLENAQLKNEVNQLALELVKLTDKVNKTPMILEDIPLERRGEVEKNIKTRLLVEEVKNIPISEEEDMPSHYRYELQQKFHAKLFIAEKTSFVNLLNKLNEFLNSINKELDLFDDQYNSVSPKILGGSVSPQASPYESQKLSGIFNLSISPTSNEEDLSWGKVNEYLEAINKEITKIKLYHHQMQDKVRSLRRVSNVSMQNNKEQAANSLEIGINKEIDYCIGKVDGVLQYIYIKVKNILDEVNRNINANPVVWSANKFNFVTLAVDEALKSVADLIREINKISSKEFFLDQILELSEQLKKVTEFIKKSEEQVKLQELAKKQEEVLKQLDELDENLDKTLKGLLKIELTKLDNDLSKKYKAVNEADQVLIELISTIKESRNDDPIVAKMLDHRNNIETYKERIKTAKQNIKIILQNPDFKDIEDNTEKNQSLLDEIDKFLITIKNNTVPIGQEIETILPKDDFGNMKEIEPGSGKVGENEANQLIDNVELLAKSMADNFPHATSAHITQTQRLVVEHVGSPAIIQASKLEKAINEQLSIVEKAKEDLEQLKTEVESIQQNYELAKNKIVSSMSTIRQYLTDVKRAKQKTDEEFVAINDIATDIENKRAQLYQVVNEVDKLAEAIVAPIKNQIEKELDDLANDFNVQESKVAKKFEEVDKAHQIYDEAVKNKSSMPNVKPDLNAINTCKVYIEACRDYVRAVERLNQYEENRKLIEFQFEDIALDVDDRLAIERILESVRAYRNIRPILPNPLAQDKERLKSLLNHEIKDYVLKFIQYLDLDEKIINVNNNLVKLQELLSSINNATSEQLNQDALITYQTQIDKLSENTNVLYKEAINDIVKLLFDADIKVDELTSGYIKERQKKLTELCAEIEKLIQTLLQNVTCKIQELNKRQANVNASSYELAAAARPEDLKNEQQSLAKQQEEARIRDQLVKLNESLDEKLNLLRQAESELRELTGKDTESLVTDCALVQISEHKLKIEKILDIAASVKKDADTELAAALNDVNKESLYLITLKQQELVQLINTINKLAGNNISSISSKVTNKLNDLQSELIRLQEYAKTQNQSRDKAENAYKKSCDKKDPLVLTLDAIDASAECLQAFNLACNAEKKVYEQYVALAQIKAKLVVIKPEPTVNPSESLKNTKLTIEAAENDLAKFLEGASQKDGKLYKTLNTEIKDYLSKLFADLDKKIASANTAQNELNTYEKQIIEFNPGLLPTKIARKQALKSYQANIDKSKNAVELAYMQASQDLQKICANKSFKEMDEANKITISNLRENKLEELARLTKKIKDDADKLSEMIINKIDENDKTNHNMSNTSETDIHSTKQATPQNTSKNAIETSKSDSSNQTTYNLWQTIKPYLETNWIQPQSLMQRGKKYIKATASEWAGNPKLANSVVRGKNKGQATSYYIEIRFIETKDKQNSEKLITQKDELPKNLTADQSIIINFKAADDKIKNSKDGSIKNNKFAKLLAYPRIEITAKSITCINTCHASEQDLQEMANLIKTGFGKHAPINLTLPEGMKNKHDEVARLIEQLATQRTPVQKIMIKGDKAITEFTDEDYKSLAEKFKERKDQIIESDMSNMATQKYLACLPEKVRLNISVETQASISSENNENVEPDNVDNLSVDSNKSDVSSDSLSGLLIRSNSS